MPFLNVFRKFDQLHVIRLHIQKELALIFFLISECIRLAFSKEQKKVWSEKNLMRPAVEILFTFVIERGGPFSLTNGVFSSKKHYPNDKHENVFA